MSGTRIAACLASGEICSACSCTGGGDFAGGSAMLEEHAATMVSEASPTARKLKADETMVLHRCKLHANSQRALEGAAHLLAMGAGARDSMRRRISFEVSLSSERTVTAKPSPTDRTLACAPRSVSGQ